MSESCISVLCVDDHRLMREGIVRILGLQSDMSVVAQAASGEEAVEEFLRHRPDVTLMDLQLPRMDGVQAIRAIRREAPAARIVVLTVYQGDEDIHSAIEAGACAYLLKDTLSDELIRVIREVHAGQLVIPAEVASQLAMRKVHPALSPREIEVLRLLAAGMRNKEIAAKLDVGVETVHAHTRSIFAKLNVHDRTAALGVALRRGIIHIP